MRADIVPFLNGMNKVFGFLSLQAVALISKVSETRILYSFRMAGDAAYAGNYVYAGKRTRARNFTRPPRVNLRGFFAA